MIPPSLALVDDDAEFREYLTQYLETHGVGVSAYDDSDALLADAGAHDHAFYLVDLELPGIDGVDLIRVLRRRTQAGILVVSARAEPDAFAAAIQAGADMYLAKPVRFEQVLVALKAVHRRAAAASPAATPWRLDRPRRQLLAPGGAAIALSPTQFEIMDCLLGAGGAPVTREALRERLAQTAAGESDNALHAAIYRLRRQVERATERMFPLQSVSRVGYVFRAPLAAS